MFLLITALCLNLVVLPVIDAVQQLSTIKILIGNTNSQRAEVYQVSFNCDSDPCVAREISPYDLLWASPQLAATRITDVKRVVYNNLDAILVTQDANVLIFAYPSAEVLFNRTLDAPGTSIHSGEVLPDGNVAVVVSTLNSIYIFRPCKTNCSNDHNMDSYVEAKETPVKFGHGLVFDRKRSKLIALGYLEVHIFSYQNATESRNEVLLLDKTIPLNTYYISKDHYEDFFLADGGHDLFPIEGGEDMVFLTTGERVFMMDAETHQIRKDNFFYYLNSRHGQVDKVEVPFKSGVKSISKDSSNNLTLVHAAPWFKELYNNTSGVDDNYSSISNNLIWSVEDGRCAVPDFDMTDDCKISFFDVNVTFYKARLFNHHNFSYDLSQLKK